jgi:hypothetical protein
MFLIALILNSSTDDYFMDLNPVKGPNRVQPDFQRSARRQVDLAKNLTLPASKAA